MKKFCITIGNFDGVHRGHQHLIEKAFQRSSVVKVLTFHPHPLQVLKPEHAPPRLFDYHDQQRLLTQHRVSEVEVIHFTPEFAKLTGHEFFTAYIARPGTEHVVVGENFRFGCDRKAGWLEIKKWGADKQIGVTCVDPIVFDNEVVSSSRIRDCLSRGDLEGAQNLLGRRYEICGVVVNGERRGRQLGFPTANLRLAPEMKNRLALMRGVYFGHDVENRKFVLNVGLNPTVSSTPELKVEAHFLEFDGDREGDLYGKELRLQLHGHLRPEIRFEGLDSLRAQIQKDIHEAQARMKS